MANPNPLSFGDFRKEFLGNGHKISNFSISYSAFRADLIEDFEDSSKKSLAISLFGQTDGAKIKDVVFENVSVDISILANYDDIYKIYFAPLSVSATKYRNFKCYLQRKHYSDKFAQSNSGRPGKQTDCKTYRSGLFQGRFNYSYRIYFGTDHIHH